MNEAQEEFYDELLNTIKMLVKKVSDVSDRVTLLERENKFLKSKINRLENIK